MELDRAAIKATAARADEVDDTISEHYTYKTYLDFEMLMRCQNKYIV